MEENISWVSWVILIWLAVSYYNLTNKVKLCSDAVNIANVHISMINEQVQQTKNVAWGNYRTMGDAIDSLFVVPQVANPCAKDK